METTCALTENKVTASLASVIFQPEVYTVGLVMKKQKTNPNQGMFHISLAYNLANMSRSWKSKEDWGIVLGTNEM